MKTYIVVCEHPKGAYFPEQNVADATHLPFVVQAICADEYCQRVDNVFMFDSSRGVCENASRQVAQMCADYINKHQIDAPLNAREFIEYKLGFGYIRSEAA